MRLRNVRTNTFSLTSGGYTLLSNARARQYLDIPNPDETDIRLHFGNPFCLSFDSGDHVVVDGIVADTTLLASTTGMIGARVRVDNTAAVKTIFSVSKATVTAAKLQFYIDADEKLGATLQTAAASVKWTLGTDAALTVDRWYDVKVVHNGTTPTLYVNGEKVAQTFTVTTDKTAWIADLSALIDKARIGSLYTLGAESVQFDGELKDVVVRDGLANGVLIDDITLIARWPLQDGSGTTPDDISANGYDGTFGAGGAAPTWAAIGDGQPLGAGIWWDEPNAIPSGPVYAYTAAAGVTLDVTEGFEGGEDL